MFEAKEIDVAKVEPDVKAMNRGSGAGRGFAVSGGVARAVADLIHETQPDLEVKTANAEGLQECRKLMMLAKAGKYNGYLLEGMGCPGGCIAGAGTVLPVNQAKKLVQSYQSIAPFDSPTQSEFKHMVAELEI